MQTVRSPVTRLVISTVVEGALEVLGVRGGEDAIEVSFNRDTAMRALNRRTRAKDKTTDVLSFPNFEAKNGKVKQPAWAMGQPLGSIVICVDVAKRQAKEFQHSLRDEVVRLLVHGVCHVVGYDHERSPSEERKMFKMEDAILQHLRLNTPQAGPKRGRT